MTTLEANPMTQTTNEVLLEAAGLKKHFPVTKGLLVSKVTGWIKAVDGVSFQIRAGETLGIVGESGCGKSTTAKMLLQLEEPTEGTIRYQGDEIHNASAEQRRAYRSSVQAVFQDPWSSLNPRMRVRDLIAEPMVINLNLSRREMQERVAKLLNDVGLSSYHANLYPHEFSGGQRQRLAIARALSVEPRVIVLDEAGFGAGRVHSRPDHEPADGPAERVQRQLSADRPPPGNRAVHVRLGGRDVPGADRGIRPHQGTVRQRVASLHQGADERGVAVAPGHRAGGNDPHRRSAFTAQSRPKAAGSTPGARSSWTAAPGTFPK